MAALSAIYWGMWAATQAWPRTLSSADFTYAQEEDIDSLVHDRKMEQKQIPLFLLEGLYCSYDSLLQSSLSHTPNPSCGTYVAA